MEAIKTTYNDLPEMIMIPKEFVHKKGEVIFILDDSVSSDKNTDLTKCFGTIPDFPERFTQGKYEERDSL